VRHREKKKPQLGTKTINVGLKESEWGFSRYRVKVDHAAPP
jgi:hypothetical protein